MYMHAQSCRFTQKAHVTCGHIWQVNTIKEDEVVRVETQDWTGGQIKDTDSAEDMKNIDLSLVSLTL